MTLNKIERLILANQFKVLERLHPHRARKYAEACEILEYGHSLHYDELFQNFTEGLAEEQCREVMDILDMYRALNASYSSVPQDRGDSTGSVLFRGFDGNNETAYMAYAYFLIHKKQVWQELSKVDLNSHVEMLPRYRAMLRRWNSSANRYELTKDEILWITDGDGRRYP